MGFVVLDSATSGSPKGIKQMTWREFWANAFVIPRKPPLSDADRALSAWVATELQRRNLDVPAILVVESCQPLAGIAAQLMIFLEPTLSLFMRPGDIARFREFIEKEGALDDLVTRLQDQSQVDHGNVEPKHYTEASSGLCTSIETADAVVPSTSSKELSSVDSPSEITDKP